jgi:hypothetical protein
MLDISCIAVYYFVFSEEAQFRFSCFVDIQCHIFHCCWLLVQHTGRVDSLVSDIPELSNLVAKFLIVLSPVLAALGVWISDYHSVCLLLLKLVRVKLNDVLF